MDENDEKIRGTPWLNPHFSFPVFIGWPKIWRAQNLESSYRDTMIHCILVLNLKGFSTSIEMMMKWGWIARQYRLYLIDFCWRFWYGRVTVKILAAQSQILWFLGDGTIYRLSFYQRLDAIRNIQNPNDNRRITQWFGNVLAVWLQPYDMQQKQRILGIAANGVDKTINYGSVPQFPVSNPVSDH